MINYCTLFNKAYLPFGMAMYSSLKSHSKQRFHLFVLAMDIETWNEMSSKNYDEITCIRLSDFEDENLLSIKPQRSFGEYCWTCTPSLIHFCIKNFNLNQCIYLDADIFFFNNPEMGWNEMPENYSIFLTEHNYHPNHDRRFSNGLYCVQYIGFRNNEAGMTALNYWKESCIKWCFSKVEEGKFGDQKYLDDWLVRFKGVWVAKNKGLGLAPWNSELFELIKNGDYYNIIDKVTREEFPLIFFHFHGLRFYKNKIRLTEYVYQLNDLIRKEIYPKYIVYFTKNINVARLQKFPWSHIIKLYIEIIKQKSIIVINIFTLKRDNPFNNLIKF